MDKAELRDVLHVLTVRRRRSYPPVDPTQLEVFLAVRELMVQFPRSPTRIPTESEVLLPLVQSFGDPSSTLEQRTRLMFECCVDAAVDDKEGWRRILMTSAIAEVRMNTKSGYRSISNRRAHELCGLIIGALDKLMSTNTIGDRTNEDVEESLPSQAADARQHVRIVEGTVGAAAVFLVDRPGDKDTIDQLESSVESPSVKLTIQLRLNTITGGTSFRTSLEGDVDSWYLAMITAKGDRHPLPHTEVVMTGEPEDYTMIQNGGAFHIVSSETVDDDVDESEIMGEYKGGIYQVQATKGAIVRRYERPADEVIGEICRVAIQYCREYYPNPQWVAMAVALVLDAVWNPPDRDSFYSLRARLNLELSTSFLIPKWALERYAQQDRVNPKKLYQYVQKILRRVEFMDDDEISILALPAIIDRWLRGTDCDPAFYFNPWNWQLSGPVP